MQRETVRTEIAADTAADILKSVSIPPCPTVAAALMEEARREEVDFMRINRLISGDVSLAAAMMKTANSPFFALQKKASTVQQAVSVLGLKNIINIVTGLCLQQALSPKGISMDRFWDRSNYHAAASSRIVRQRRLGVSMDDAYAFGLFHDCGIPILMQRFPDYKDTLALANSSDRSMLALENEIHGTDHAAVGAMLARNWQLPPTVVEAIRTHHDLEALHPGQEEKASPVQNLAAVSLLADHYIAGFLGVADEAEWNRYGELATDFLNLEEDDVANLYEDVCEDLVEIHKTRG
ncbi:HDOD domain-containing protein [Denitratisoma sp. agr-D3]